MEVTGAGSLAPAGAGALVAAGTGLEAGAGACMEGAVAAAPLEPSPVEAEGAATIENVVVPKASAPELALMVIEPAAVAVTVFVATPAELVALPRPLTVPVPALLLNATEMLGEVTLLPLASLTSTVSPRFWPTWRLAVELVNTSLAAAPGLTRIELELALAVRPPEALSVIVSARVYLTAARVAVLEPARIVPVLPESVPGEPAPE